MRLLMAAERLGWCARNGRNAPGVGHSDQRSCRLQFAARLHRLRHRSRLSWTSAGSKRTYTGNGDPTELAINLDDKVRWFGTLRTRTGVVVDNLLLYATGGLALAKTRNSWQAVDESTLTETFTDSATRWGWTAGVGTEWALSNNLSIKSEALYVRLSERSVSGFSPSADRAFNFDQSGFALGCPRRPELSMG